MAKSMLLPKELVSGGLSSYAASMEMQELFYQKTLRRMEDNAS